MKKIVMTGGGTAGHVTPNIALFGALKDSGYEIHYIGSKNGMEKELIEKTGVLYYGVSSGKLRRYLDMKNFTDAFKVVKGFTECINILRKIQPDVVFSKGGFVIVPVVLAAKFLNIPVVLHESDITPGLANKIAIPFSKALCITFPETKDHVKNKRVFLTGTPIRESLFDGNREIGMKLCNFSANKSVLLIMGGSQGSQKINKTLRECLDALLKSYNIIHLCGKGNIDESLKNLNDYAQFEYLNDELPHIMAAADIVISRAGANSIFEFLALKKPNLLIPLSKNASRGDQILNAESFAKQGYSKVIYEEDLEKDSLILEIIDLYSTREKFIENMANSQLNDGVNAVVKIINRYAKK